jgi:hypothetical protein
MKISHNLILKESLIELLEEVYDIHSQSQVVNATTNLSRCMKCVELDVKLLLKMSLSFEPKATDNNEENIFIATVKLTLSTSCTSLRKVNHFWNDNEMITIRLEMTCKHFDYLADKIIEHLNHFKICKICRILYKDPRDISPTSICKYCYFDRIFLVQEASCAICQEAILPGVQTFTLTCSHIYHSECILTQFIKSDNRNCPLCREQDHHEI